MWKSLSCARILDSHILYALCIEASIRNGSDKELCYCCQTSLCTVFLAHPSGTVYSLLSTPSHVTVVPSVPVLKYRYSKLWPAGSELAVPDLLQQLHQFLRPDKDTITARRMSSNGGGRWLSGKYGRLTYHNGSLPVYLFAFSSSPSAVFQLPNCGIEPDT